MTSLVAELRAATEDALRRLQGEAEEDEWGFDAGALRAAQPLLDLLFDRWWRVTVTGGSRVPVTGPGLIVANHAGVLPWDAAMVATAVRRASGRHPRTLVLDWATRVPWASLAIRRLGGVPASPHNARSLLEQGHLVTVFPEGSRGSGKPWRDRYRLERFGRGGVVELALRTRVPIIPCAVVGHEEIYPRLTDLPLVGRLLGVPRLPVTPTFPLLGPLGAVPLPSRWRLAFGPPINLHSHGPGAALDRSLVLRLADDVRETLQTMVGDELVRRGRAFL